MVGVNGLGLGAIIWYVTSIQCGAGGRSPQGERRVLIGPSPPSRQYKYSVISVIKVIERDSMWGQVIGVLKALTKSVIFAKDVVP